MQKLLMAPFRHLINSQKEARRSQFELLAPAPGGVLFLGDSITEQGNWNEWFPGRKTLNRGIGGDTVGGIVDRLESAINDPDLISLLIGTNDLGGGGRVQDIAGQMERLVAQVTALAPRTLLLINSVMPRKPNFADRVLALNEHYRRIALSAGAEYVDLWPVLADHQGGLRTECTNDGLHLRGLGYRAWVDTLGPYLASDTPVQNSTKEGAK